MFLQKYQYVRKEEAMTDKKQTIHEAVSAAMAEVRILGKDGTNAHQKYKFASIDAFLEMVNPIARKHGVFISITEIEPVEMVEVKERSGTALYAKFVYGIAATGKSGDRLEPSKQTVFLRFVGPQTTGQALAYAMKMYLRMLFLIPTGDKDADLQEQIDAVSIGGPVSAGQAEALSKMVEATESNLDAFLKYYGAESIEQFPAGKFNAAMSQLKTKVK